MIRGKIAGDEMGRAHYQVIFRGDAGRSRLFAESPLSDYPSLKRP
jgi:hypothetical protein